MSFRYALDARLLLLQAVVGFVWYWELLLLIRRGRFLSWPIISLRQGFGGQANRPQSATLPHMASLHYMAGLCYMGFQLG
jgi:hypothetical protein